MLQDFLQVKRLEGYGLTDLPDFKSEFSSGMDLCANFLVTDKKKEVLIPSNGRIMISTGLAIEIPKIAKVKLGQGRVYQLIMV